MKNIVSTLIFLIVVAFAGIYFLLSGQQSQPQGAQPLFNDLAEKANSLDSIMVENFQGVIFSANQQNGNWVSQVEGVDFPYPVDEAKLAALVSDLVEGKLIEAKTAKQENYPLLGISDIDSQDSMATLVSLKAGELEWKLLIGNKATSGNGSYVRMPDEQQSWLIDKVLSPPTQQIDLLRQPILDITADDIQSVKREGTQQWMFSRVSDTDQFVLNSLPEGREVKYEGILSGFVNNLVGAKFEQIVAADEEVWADSTPSMVLQLTTQSQQEIKVEMVELNDSNYLRFVDESDSTAYWNRLTYKVSTFTGSQLNKQIEDFLLQAPQDIDAGPSIDEGEAPQ